MGEVRSEQMSTWQVVAAKIRHSLQLFFVFETEDPLSSLSNMSRNFHRAGMTALIALPHDTHNQKPCIWAKDLDFRRTCFLAIIVHYCSARWSDDLHGDLIDVGCTFRSRSPPQEAHVAAGS